jgi:hypothetical protein
MTTQPKTTLFTINTTRSPELLSEFANQNYYIKHPNNSAGVFYAAVNNRPIGISVREAMITASAVFNSLNYTELIDINEDLYNFTRNFLVNKEDLKYDELNNAMLSIESLSENDKILLWDNLFYQTITLEDNYIRERVILILIANHIKENFTNIDQNNEAAVEWAKSRVVVPKDLFAVDTVYHTATTKEVDYPNPDLVVKNIKAAESLLRIELAKNSLTELELLERNYLNIQKLNEKNFAITYNENLKNEIALAPKIDVLDQFSGFTFSQFSTPFIVPSYTWNPDDQIDITNIESNTTEYTFFLLNQNDLLIGNTFNDVKKDVSKFINFHLENAFNETKFINESIDINGTAIPTCSLDNRYNQKYSFCIKTVKKAENKYAILLSVDTKIDCIKLVSASITCGGVFAKFDYVVVNGVVTIDFTPNAHADILNSELMIPCDGQLIFNNGLKLSWDMPISISDVNIGTMQDASNSNGNVNLFIPSGYGLTRIGIAEYKRVEQYLCCYIPGEVSHIENVMAREYKERSTRRLRRSENTIVTGSDYQSENQTDTSTTSRYDIQREITSVIQESSDQTKNQSFHAGLSANISSYGNVDLSYDSGSNYAVNSSKTQSNKDAINISKDIVQKALQKVILNVKEERTQKIIEEFEEQNKHGFDNRLGNSHISGVFRWIDAKYNNQLQNYGKRLQYEFMIPEPSAFHLIAKASGISSGNESPIIQPLDPRKDQFGNLNPLKASNSIDENNYYLWAALYNAEVSPPPARIQVLGKSYKMPDDGQPWYTGTKAISENIVLPEGYGLNKAYVSAIGERGASWGRYYIAVGDNTREYWSGNIPKQIFLEDNENLELDKYIESIPVGVQFVGITAGLVTVTIELLRKSELFAKWQLETYNSIIVSYELRLQEYKDRLAELEAKKAGLIKDNPAYFRDIEKIVLKKNCLSYLIGHSKMGKSMVSGSEVQDYIVKINEELDQYSTSVKFFEQAFEWEIMSYVFYPFYWAGTEKWTKLYNLNSDDSLFKSFLQSGMARVIVTVRPGFEEAVMHYVQTGLIWDGGEVPVVGDELYLSIIEELKVPEYTVDDIWETKIPTTLSIIQSNSISLDASGLPCWCDTLNPPNEGFIEDNSSLSNLNVFIDGYTSPQT